VKLELAKGERNCCIFINLLDQTLHFPLVFNLINQINPNYVSEISENKREAFLHFNSRHIAERVRSTIDREFNKDGKESPQKLVNNRLAVFWADKDNLLIALHLSFNKENANIKSSQFTKEKVETFFSQGGLYKCVVFVTFI
jgi:hypothetical protein